MAQHYEMKKSGVKRLVNRANNLLGKKFTHSNTSMRWNKIDDKRSVSFRTVKWGGTDCMVEVTTNEQGVVNGVYLVA